MIVAVSVLIKKDLLERIVLIIGYNSDSVEDATESAVNVVVRENKDWQLVGTCSGEVSPEFETKQKDGD